jgi:hypothetical protein
MITIQLRRDVASEWYRVNPILAAGEPGYEEDTTKFKIGDGVSRWSDLNYFSPGDSIPDEGGVGQEALLAHIHSLVPHPVYDDGPSLLLLYQNAKV